MKRKEPKDPLTISQSDLAASFYDMAIDYLRESFVMIAKRVVPKGFGKLKSSVVFKKEAQRMFKFAR